MGTKTSTKKCKHGVLIRLCLRGCSRARTLSFIKRLRKTPKSLGDRKFGQRIAKDHEIVRQAAIKAGAPESSFITTSRDTRGRKTGLSFSSPIGGRFSTPPTLAAAYWLRGRMQPINIAPSKVFDAEGRHIATYTVDPITGKRTRAEV